MVGLAAGVDRQCGAEDRVPGSAGPAGDGFGSPVTTSRHGRRPVSRHPWARLVTAACWSACWRRASRAPGRRAPRASRVTTSGPRWRPTSHHRPTQLVTGGPKSSPRCADSTRRRTSIAYWRRPTRGVTEIGRQVTGSAGGW